MFLQTSKLKPKFQIISGKPWITLGLLRFYPSGLRVNPKVNPEWTQVTPIRSTPLIADADCVVGIHTGQDLQAVEW